MGGRGSDHGGIWGRYGAALSRTGFADHGTCECLFDPRLTALNWAAAFTIMPSVRSWISIGYCGLQVLAGTVLGLFAQKKFNSSLGPNMVRWTYRSTHWHYLYVWLQIGETQDYFSMRAGLPDHDCYWRWFLINLDKRHQDTTQPSLPRWGLIGHTRGGGLWFSLNASKASYFLVLTKRQLFQLLSMPCGKTCR